MKMKDELYSSDATKGTTGTERIPVKVQLLWVLKYTYWSIKNPRVESARSYCNQLEHALRFLFLCLHVVVNNVAVKYLRNEKEEEPQTKN